MAEILSTTTHFADLERLEEMYDAMNDSIDNANKVLGQQHCLIDIIESSSSAEQFKDFIESLKDQCNDIAKQIDTLVERRHYFESIKTKVEASSDEEQFLHELIEFLGVFANRG